MDTTPKKRGRPKGSKDTKPRKKRKEVKYLKKEPKDGFIRLRIDKKTRQQLEYICENSDNGRGGKMKMSEMIRSLIDGQHFFQHPERGYNWDVVDEEGNPERI